MTRPRWGRWMYMTTEEKALTKSEVAEDVSQRSLRSADPASNMMDEVQDMYSDTNAANNDFLAKMNYNNAQTRWPEIRSDFRTVTPSAIVYR